MEGQMAGNASGSDSQDPLLSNGNQPAVDKFILPPRKKRHWWAAGAVVLVVAVYLAVQLIEGEFFSSDDFPNPNRTFQLCYLITLLWLLLVASILAELLFRLLLLVEELLHVETRYKGSHRSVFYRTLWGHYCWLIIAIFIVCSIMVVIMVGVTRDGKDAFVECWQLNHNIFLLLVTFQSVVHAAVGLREPSRVEVAHKMEKASNDVAHGLAWSQYYGFIEKITSPVKITEDGQTRTTDLINYVPTFVATNAEIKGKIEEARAVNLNILVILIPESCNIPDTIEGVELIGHVPYDLSSAGNIGRGYGQSLYIVRPPEQHTEEGIAPSFCCMAVYADNLKTLLKMSETPEGGLSADERYEQMRLYVASLRDIIKRRKAENFIVLLPFDDKEENSVSELMWTELKKIYKKQQNQLGRPS